MRVCVCVCACACVCVRYCALQCFVPSKVEAMLRRDCELIGRLHYREGHDLYHWRVGWFALAGSTLTYSSGEGEEEELQLRQLQELSKTHPPPPFHHPPFLFL